MIRAQLEEDDGIRRVLTAMGNQVRSTTPVLTMCRLLVNCGVHPATPMEVYRGQVLSLRIRSIGEASKLKVREEPGPPRLVNRATFLLREGAEETE